MTVSSIYNKIDYFLLKPIHETTEITINIICAIASTIFTKIKQAYETVVSYFTEPTPPRDLGPHTSTETLVATEAGNACRQLEEARVQSPTTSEHDSTHRDKAKIKPVNLDVWNETCDMHHTLNFNHSQAQQLDDLWLINHLSIPEIPDELKSNEYIQKLTTAIISAKKKRQCALTTITYDNFTYTMNEQSSRDCLLTLLKSIHKK